MSEENEFNARHFRWMREAILQFENKNVESLGLLVRRLDEINSVLKNPGEQWDKRFAALWLPLELTYADALEENRGNLSDIEKALNSTSIKKLAALVEEQIADYQ